MFLVRDFPPGVWPSLSASVTPCSLAYPSATRRSSGLDRHLVNCPPEKYLAQLVPLVVHPEAEFCIVFLSMAISSASLSAGLSITGGRSLPTVAGEPHAWAP